MNDFKLTNFTARYQTRECMKVLLPADLVLLEILNTYPDVRLEEIELTDIGMDGCLFAVRIRDQLCIATVGAVLGEY